MSRRTGGHGAGLAVAALAGLAVLVAGCGDLPNATGEATPVELRIVAPPGVAMYDTVVVRAEVIDPAGRLVTDAAVTLKTDDARTSVVDREDATALVIGTRPGSATIRATLADDRFVAEPAFAVLDVQYESPVVAFVGIGTDTLIESLGEVALAVSATDYRGRPLQGGSWNGWSVRRFGESVTASGWGVDTTGAPEVRGTVVREGSIRLVVTHGACGGCGDTVRVVVRQRPASLTAHDLRLTAIGDDALLEATVLDPGGSPIAAPRHVYWRLLDPADSTLIRLSGARAIARSPGEARVVGWTGELEDTATVRVTPVWTELAIEGPVLIDALGRADTIRVSGRDANGNVVAAPEATVTWFVDPPSILALEPLGPTAVITGLDIGRAIVRATARACDSCATIETQRAIDVTPAVDSFRVRATADRLNYLGAVTRLSAHAYVGGEGWTINGVTWTALDPAVAVVDAEGVVTARAEGDARFVGSVGSYVDTAAIVVRQVVRALTIDPGPALVVGAMDTLQVQAVDSAGYLVVGRAIAWTSGDPGVAGVDGAGVMTGASEGSTVVTAAVDPVTATRGVLVFDPGYTLGHSQDAPCVISASGTPYCGENGLLPYPMTGVTDFSAAGGAMCGATAAEGWRCMGENDAGQLGVGDLIDRPSPTPLAGPVPLVLVDAVGHGSYRPHSCGLSGDGRAWCWGDNADGRLGILDQDALVPTPRPVDTEVRFRDIAVESNLTCAAATDGAAWCWGGAFLGQATPIRPLLVEESGGLVSIETGDRLACGLTGAGTALCWGDNTFGELGAGPSLGRLSAAPVSGNHVFRTLSVGRNHVCGVASSGEVLCWGRNRDRELGDGTFYDRDTPVVAAAGHSFVDVVAVRESTVAKTVEGSTWLWGRWGGGASSRWPPDSWTPGFRYVELIRGAP